MQTETMRTREIKKSYRYEDESGKLLFEVVRYEPKDFRQRRPDPNGGWIYNTAGVRKVLYRLPELIAVPLAEPVFIVEGEKDVDRLMSHGLPATTNPGGAGKWLESFNEYFEGRLVAIIPDNDEPGRKHAKNIAENLYGVASSVKIVELPGLPAKGDVSDWLETADNDFRKLCRIADNSPQYVKEEQWTRRADVVRMSEIEPEDVQWLWPGRFPLGMITLLAGDPDLGKSYLSLFLATTVSKGGTWPDGTPCSQAQALILNGEDALAATVRNRLKILGADTGKIIAIRSMRQKDANGVECSDNFNIAGDRMELERILKENADIRLVIIDPLSSYFGSADTFKESVVRSILSPLAEMASRFNVALVCIMHLNKGNSTKAIYRTQGSLAFPAAARAVWIVSNEPSNPNGKRRFLINVKFNIGERPSSLAFEIKDGSVVFETQPVNITSQDIFASAASAGGIEAPERSRAVDWLKELLSSVDSMPSNEIFKLAEQEGFKERMLARARKELGIKCFPEFDDDGNKSWFWRLPNPEGDIKKLPTLSEMYEKMNKMKERTMASLSKMSQ